MVGVKKGGDQVVTFEIAVFPKGVGGDSLAVEEEDQLGEAAGVAPPGGFAVSARCSGEAVFADVLKRGFNQATPM